ncbi:MAG: nucleotidyltransferase family protein [Candidatus Omnitrophota bacterium]|nr:nucleotidyltransferase family protein [Candidatus Omnitrophota bacterium]
MISSLRYRERAGFNIASLDKLNTLFKELEPFLKILLLKGISLLNTVYACDIGARHLGDVDILVRKKDFPRLKKTLHDKGYLFNNNITRPLDTCYLNSATCAKEDKFCPPFHIHWHLSNAAFSTALFSPRINLEKIWQEAEPLSGFKNVWIMSSHHQLIHLGEHALKHSYDRPYLLEDIQRVIEYYQRNLCWEKLIVDAKAFNLTRPLYHSLHFAADMRGARVPARVLSSLKPERFSFLEKRFIAAVRKGKRSERLSGIVYLEMNKTCLDKVSYVWRTFFPPVKMMAQFRNSSGLKRLNPIDYCRRAYKGLNYFLDIGRCLF